MSASPSTSAAAVAGQQRESKGFVGVRAPRALLYLEHRNEDTIFDDQMGDSDGHDDPITPPLTCDSDASSFDTPSHLHSDFDDWDGPSATDTAVTVSVDQANTQVIEISADNPFYHPPQRRPFDYAPFSDPSFPYNFDTYSEEPCTEEGRVTVKDCAGVLSKGLESILLAPIATVLVADAEFVDDDWASFDSPERLHSTVEFESKQVSDLPIYLTYEDIDCLALGPN
ncbi:hypothetical protein AX17_007113 [Amanita inopinata Kibby_2008]|nr:hypothetical protein AX17_007113 [Amanita inopinata Kibby_2008]